METQVAEPETGTARMPQGQEPKSAGGVRTNPRARRAIVAGAALAFVIGLGLYLYYSNKVSTDDAEVDGHIVPMASKIYGTVAEILVHEPQTPRRSLRPLRPITAVPRPPISRPQPPTLPTPRPKFKRRRPPATRRRPTLSG